MLTDKQKIKIYERFLNTIASANDADDLLQLHVKVMYWKNAHAKSGEYSEEDRQKLIEKATIRLNL